ncbi:MFS transporter [Actinomadura sp. LD22]|uniref:MFS transporter n=1 Tax=Actinomadura physcomitrii TaxID=2650748 RepID=A0A6I4M932_9ACTN|nr:MFS transporter [Actinomadura physcomitrii]MWA02678.1 MFS transporter [Actinomadura physcomitrii]
MTSQASTGPRSAARARTLRARAVTLVLGDGVAPSLWPILLITLVSTATFTGVWSYAGVWAQTSVHASSTAVGLMFLGYAVGCGVTGYVGGRMSDRLGRRRVMAGGWALACLLIVLLPLVPGGPATKLGCAVLAMAAGSPATAASNTAVADLVDEGEQERAYAATRVMFNIGSVLGPPLAGLVLLKHNWTLLFVCAGALGFVTVAAVLRWMPARTGPRENGQDWEAKPSATGTIWRDRPFVLLLASTFLGYFIYVTYSSVLPVVAVSSYRLAPSAWGFIYAINPIIVVLFQMRTTRLTRNLSASTKLILASLLMGVSFLILVALPNAAGIVLLACAFVIGEMLWAPVSQSLAVRMAPDGMRGSYMGAFRGAGQIAMGLAPFVMLRVHGFGNTPTWLTVSLVSVLGAGVGWAAARGVRRGSREEDSA